jgi:uncharacterized protein
MARAAVQVARMSTGEARRLLLGAQGLLARPPRATAQSVYQLVLQLGYVQIDSINVVERAHHLILGSRLLGYRPSLLQGLLERQRRLFEHWTHDAAAIPTVWFPHWHERFERFRSSSRLWWRERMGKDSLTVVARVRERLRLDGPLAVRELAEAEGHAGGGGSWWGWSPAKAALEYLWRTGEVAIAGRRSFHKVYDLVERVLPEAAALPPPSPAAHVDWACRTAIERLGVATPEEVAAFWHSIPAATARRWCADAASRGELLAVSVQAAPKTVDARPGRLAFAVPDWQERARVQSASGAMRLLCPFDPILRDRRRALRLFGFDFRFEGFVPAGQRQHGYYVMPILEGEHLVGRIDPKLHRQSQRLEVRSVRWEAGIRPSRRRLAALDTAVGRLATRLGATAWDLPPAAKH